MFAARLVREAAAAMVSPLATLALLVAPGVAGTTLTLPATGSGSVDGPGLTVTNTQDFLGAGHPRPFGIEGLATGRRSGGVLGQTTRREGIGVYGLNSSSGRGGYFVLSGAAAGDGDSALEALNSGGSKTVNGPYGNAGFFEIGNVRNTDTAVFIETFGNGTALHAETHGAETASAAEGYDYSSIGGTGVFGYSLNGTAAEFIHGSGGNNRCTYNGASSGWNCTSSAAMMEHFSPVDFGALLDRLEAMPIGYFSTKGAKFPARELGPSAEDFRAAFGLGRDDNSIAAGNASGVALAVAKGLYQRLKQDAAAIAAQSAVIAADRETMARQGQRIAALEQELASQRAALAGMGAAVARVAQSIGGRQAALYSAR